ncbi:MAG TPA: type 4a pilus biogenesis protein PilO [Mycobacteriales bacterium]|nr:type 4a pilus biogenesis protein PilO [Mycobacteriales bacterium]
MDKLRQWTVLTAAGALGVLAVGWFLLVSPQHTRAATLRTQAASQEQSNQSLANQVAALSAQGRELPKVQADLAKLATELPNNPGLPSLIRDLSSAADDAGIELVSLAPTTPAYVTTTTPTGGTTTSSSTSAATPQLAQIQLTIGVSGNYYNLEQFLYALEHLPRAMLVSGMQLAVNQKSGSTAPATAGSPAAPVQPGQKGELTGTINARVFLLPATAVAAAPQPLASAGSSTTK